MMDTGGLNCQVSGLKSSSPSGFCNKGPSLLTKHVSIVWKAVLGRVKHVSIVWNTVLAGIRRAGPARPTAPVPLRLGRAARPFAAGFGSRFPAFYSPFLDWREGERNGIGGVVVDP